MVVSLFGYPPPRLHNLLVICFALGLIYYEIYRMELQKKRRSGERSGIWVLPCRTPSHKGIEACLSNFLATSHVRRTESACDGRLL